MGSGTAQGELGLPLDFEEHFDIGTTLLGVGSFGTVHPATNIATGQEFAVKKLRKDLPRSQGTRGTGRYAAFLIRFRSGVLCRSRICLAQGLTHYLSIWKSMNQAQSSLAWWHAL